MDKIRQSINGWKNKITGSGHPRLKKVGSSSTKKNFAVLAGIIGVVFIGQIIISSYAAGFVFSFEPETLTLSSPTLVTNDGQASGGKYITLSPGSGTCTGTNLTPSSNIQAALDSGANGVTFCFAAGIYRIATPLNPKDDQKLIGAFGAVLNGSKVVSGWAANGSDYVATGFLPGTPGDHGDCATPGCTYTEDVYIDGSPLIRVLTRAELAPGKFFADYAANNIYLRDNPAGKTIEQAYAPHVVRSRNSGIHVKNFLIEKTANEAQYGAIQPATVGPNDATAKGTGWVIDHNEVRYNHGCGISAGNPSGGGLAMSQGGVIISNNFIHHNGQIGFCGGFMVGTVVEYNEVSYNNTAGYEKGWEAGGSKIAFSNDTVIRGNYSHHNNGPGLWTDISNYNTLYENNYISDNTHSGIEHEISYDAVITGNTILRNGLGHDASSFDSGILVYNSVNVEVSNNFMHNNHLSIFGFQHPRQLEGQNEPNWRGEKQLTGLNVHDNNVYHFLSSPDDGWFGISHDEGAAGNVIYTAPANNHFEANQHHRSSTSVTRFDWNNTGNTFNTWKNTYGHDDTGSIDTNNTTPPDPPNLDVGPNPPVDTSNGTVNVADAANYRVWARIMAPDASANSFNLKIDSGTETNFGDNSITPNTWTWVDYTNGNTSTKVNANLSSGNHTFNLSGKENGVKVDRMIFTSDTDCVPTGFGDNCASPTPPPPVFRPEDINMDGSVNLLDFSLLASKFMQSSNVGRSDINADGIVNLLDFSLLATQFGT